MRIGSQIKWAKYLASIRSPRNLKLLERGRRNRQRRGWSPGFRQSLMSHFQRELCNRPTPAELMFGGYLCELGLTPFDFQKQILTPKLYLLDFYLDKSFVAFEIDGASHENKKDADAYRDEILLSQRAIKTYRFTNDEVMQSPEETKIRIKAALSWQ